MNTSLLSIFAAAAVLFIGACARHEPAPVTTSTTTTSETQQVPVVPAQTTTTQEVHSY